jgi:chemotaxis methyl-accepting protein methylase
MAEELHSSRGRAHSQHGAGWMDATLKSVAELRILRKSPIGSYLRVNESLWRRMPPSVETYRLTESYGHFLHSLVLHQQRRMSSGTCFLRNRPELDLIRTLAIRANLDRPLRITVLGASNGAEVYSIAWAIRSAQPDFRLDLQAIDISAEVVEAARVGRYPVGFSPLTSTPLFEVMKPTEIREMFDEEGEALRVKPWLREGIFWHVGDAADPQTGGLLGLQDIVVANRFLCHMRPPDAERCLRGVARRVAPGGVLFVSGVDLDVRTKVAVELGWKPWPESLEEIHDGDSSLRHGWPFRYWGLEPIDKRRTDWTLRYASVFQLPGGSLDERPLLPLARGDQL